MHKCFFFYQLRHGKCDVGISSCCNVDAVVTFSGHVSNTCQTLTFEVNYKYDGICHHEINIYGIRQQTVTRRQLRNSNDDCPTVTEGCCFGVVSLSKISLLGIV